jgi:hypothetical protein
MTIRTFNLEVDYDDEVGVFMVSSEDAVQGQFIVIAGCTLSEALSQVEAAIAEPEAFRPPPDPFHNAEIINLDDARRHAEQTNPFAWSPGPPVRS